MSNEVCNNFIAGSWSVGTEINENINPSNLAEVVGEYARGSAQQAESAIAAACEAFPAWAKSALEDRLGILDGIGVELIARKQELGQLLSREEGKTLAEGIGEVGRAGQFFRYYAQETLRQMGDVADSVRPVVDAGLVDLVDTDHKLTDEVWLEPTPGHTPGHVSVHISSRGEEAVITGDMTHHPCQMANPHWAASMDYDQNASTATRRAFYDKYAGTPVLIIGTHFATPTAGHLVRDGDAWRLDV